MRKSPEWCRQYILDRVDIDEETGCWNWRLSTVVGYGNGKINGKTVKIHRMSYAAFQDMDIDDLPNSLEFHVLHRCIDNRKCCNPDHLYLGTKQDNMRDCIEQGRHDRFRSSHKQRRKLSDEDVRAIRELCVRGELHRVIAKNYDIGVTDVSAIKRRINYAHVD